MTDQDEGKAALEAARVAYLADIPGDAEDQFHSRFKAGLRAWMQALPGWRMVPTGLSPEMLEAFDMAQPQRGIGGQTLENMARGECNPKWRAAIKAAPQPPGLEPASHD